MQTHLPQTFLGTAAGKEADRILRSCVHCGFCTATCPTFLLTGNELDSPRGRIYLIKEMLEKDSASKTTQTHLDRCLGCQSCETTCPSNVNYHSLLNIGREKVEKKNHRSFLQKIKRASLVSILANKTLFAALVQLGKVFRFILPHSLSRQLPGKNRFAGKDPGNNNFERKIVLLNGCVQENLSSDTNNAASLVLNQLNIGTINITGESCCGAMHYHSNMQSAGLDRVRRLIDQIIHELDAGAEAVISTASGCGSFIKDYESLFLDDLEYQAKALNIQNAVKDIGEFLQLEDLSRIELSAVGNMIFHSPCTLQHGQKLSGVVEEVMQRLGFTIPRVKNSHLCCGSAGTYSILQPEMARKLQKEKITALEESGEGNIATANIGCQCHLAAATEKKVKHWIEYIAEEISGKR